MKKKIQIICVGLITLNLQLLTPNSFSQNVGINSDGLSPETNTMLDIKSAGTTSSTFGLKVKDSTGDSKMAVRSDGWVGIGTISPQGNIEVEESGDIGMMFKNWSGDAAFYLDGADADYSGNDYTILKSTSTGDFHLYTQAVERMSVLQNGRVGIGLTSPNHLLEVNGNILVNHPGNNSMSRWIGQECVNTGVGQTCGFAGMEIETIADIPVGDSNQQLHFLTHNSGVTAARRMTIDPDGRVGIGTSAPGYKLEVCGTIGTTAVSVTTGISCSSDLRYKKNIKQIENCLSKIDQIKGVEYNWKTEEFPDKNFDQRKQIGFIAQEIEEVYPELVFTDKKGYKSMDYSRLTPILLEAIKEQQQIIEKLEEDNNKQKAENNTLKAKMEEKDTELEYRIKLLEEQIKLANK